MARILIINIDGTEDRITLEKFYWKISRGIGLPVRDILLADGSMINLIQGIQLEGTEAADTIFGSDFFGDTIRGQAGNDFLVGGNGDDDYIFNRGMDKTRFLGKIHFYRMISGRTGLCLGKGSSRLTYC